MNIILERAKDNNLTCKIENNHGKFIYAYSKYKPKNIINLNINKQKQYILLGLGLGYELEYIARNTNKNVYVIEPNREFYNLILNSKELNKVLKNKNIIFLFEEEYRNIKNLATDYEIITNKNIICYNNDFYINVIEHLNRKSLLREKELVVLFDRNNISEDCKEALENIGYDVKVISYNNNKERLKMSIFENCPSYVMTINFIPLISEICNEMNKKYISWCVDTPQYTVYQKEALNDINYIFMYDEAVVRELKKKGLNKIYYMPIAANVKRLDNIILNEKDRELYKTDISFIGNLTESEYSKNIKNKLTSQTSNLINKLIQKQHNDINHFHLKEDCTQEIVNKITNETSYYITGNDFLSEKKKLAFLLGREQSFQERIKCINQINEAFNDKDVKVYGNELWNCYINNYYGQADYYEVMPKIMKLSKINLNITRTFVEAGLPMRIFDVLGVGGFLLTNYKKGLEYKFKIGADFIVYRDLQDIIDIIEYYLLHDKERIEIANNGYETIKKYHTYDDRIKEIMSIVKTTDNTTRK